MGVDQSPGHSCPGLFRFWRYGPAGGDLFIQYDLPLKEITMSIQKHLVFAAVATLATATQARAQSSECGTALTANDIRSALQYQAQGIYDGAIAGDTGDTFVPLTFHVINKSDGTGGLSEARQAQALIDANIAFSPMHIQFCKPGPTIYI